MTYLEIAVAAPITRTLTYSLSEAVQPQSESPDLKNYAGRRVLVPLGSRKITGYVLGKACSINNEIKVKGIIAFLDDEPLFPLSSVEFFRWTAEYYHHPIGEVIKAALPAGLSPESKKIIKLNSAKIRQFKAEIGDMDVPWVQDLLGKGELSGPETKRVMKEKEASIVKSMVKSGILLLESIVTEDRYKPKLERCYRWGVDVPDIFISAQLPTRDSLGTYQDNCSGITTGSLKLSELKTLYYLARLSQDKRDGAVPSKELSKAYSGSRAAVKELLEKGIVEQFSKRVFRNPLGEELTFHPRPESLTADQQRVVDIIGSACEKGQYSPFLLHGVTGSGKTEVYLRAAEFVIKKKSNVLVIVPEIALATQVESHFVSRFGQQVALLHSGMSQVERLDQYHQVMQGRARVVIGARSAIFAPLENIGLIIVDEEHDGALKQEDGLRYNGRDLAVVRAKKQNSILLLGSATPSVTSYHNAKTGKYRLLELPSRIGDQQLPRVTLIDLRKKPQKEEHFLFREKLITALDQNLNGGKQAIILLNRRGFATSMICKECGLPVQCKNCNVSLTMHQARQELLCHYCGYSTHSNTVCEACGSLSLGSVGFGTERVEEELRALFPGSHIARLDGDSGANRKKFLTTIKQMHEGEVDILVGTQMVAKGLHFPGVTLVGVVWADGGLAMPDYKAAEKTFQLVTQVTGRAGRGEDLGEVYIQTMRPEHYSIKYAAGHDYERMVEKELELRQAPEYPPYVRLVGIHVQGESQEEVKNCAKRIAECSASIIREKNMGVELLGPVPSPLDKLKGKFRWQILLKGSDVKALHQLCEYVQFVKKKSCGQRCKVVIDVDPENMM